MEADEVRKKKEAEEKRCENLARLAEASSKATEYKDKVKELAEQAKKDMDLSRNYEREIEELTEHREGSRKRLPSSSPGDSSQISKKPSTNS